MAVDGKYKIEIDTPMGKQEATLTLKAAGGKFTGSMESAMGKNDCTGTVKDNDIFWNMEINSPMGKMDLVCKGKVTGNDISGEVTAGNFGSSPFKGKRV
jgi:hypothetical protein